jgi:hypothetical protein
MLSAKRTLA